MTYSTANQVPQLISSRTIVLTVSPPSLTLSNTYGNNYVVGGLLNFSNALSSRKTAKVNSIVVNVNKPEIQGFKLTFFSDLPTTTFTDATITSINANDVPKCICTSTLGLSNTLGTHSMNFINNVNIPVYSTSQNLYALLQTSGTLTTVFSTINDLSITISLTQDL